MADLSPLSILFSAAAIGQSRLRPPQKVQISTDELQVLSIDCTLSESHDYEAEVTEFELERGADISDHRRTKPVSLTLAGIISDIPLDKDIREEAARLFGGPITGFGIDAVTAAQKLLSGDVRISVQAFEKLKALHEGSVTFTVWTPLRLYTNMVILSLRISKDPRTGSALPFMLTMRELRFVETATTIITVAAAQQRTRLGQQNGKDAPQSLKDKAGGAFKALDAVTHGGASAQVEWLQSQGIKP